MIIMAKRIPVNCNIPISSHILERMSVILSDMMLCSSSSDTLCLLVAVFSSSFFRFFGVFIPANIIIREQKETEERNSIFIGV